jgi:hypothetical protein
MNGCQRGRVKRQERRPITSVSSESLWDMDDGPDVLTACAQHAPSMPFIFVSYLVEPTGTQVRA